MAAQPQPKADKGLLPRRDLTGPAPDQTPRQQMEAIQRRLDRRGPKSKDPSEYRAEKLD